LRKLSRTFARSLSILLKQGSCRNMPSIAELNSPICGQQHVQGNGGNDLLDIRLNT
jgi:hypothetical protein